MVRIVSLSDDAYEDLKKLKVEGESFSEVVRRIVKKETGMSFLSLAGVWKDDKEIGGIFKEVLEDRKKATWRV